MRIFSSLILTRMVISIAIEGEELRAVNATDILNEINYNQSAEFNNCKILDDLNLSTLIIDGPVNFSNTSFLKSVNFDSTRFMGLSSFEHAIFYNNASFVNTSFNGVANFNSAKFIKSTRFKDTSFNNRTTFKYSAFDGPAFFWGSKFEGYTEFSSSKFNDTVDFGFTRFDKDTTFWNSRFKGIVNFFRSQFNNKADFNNAAFVGISQKAAIKSNNFMDSTFKYYANFRNCTFKGDTTFRNIEFHQDADFEKSKFNGPVDFKDAMFNNAKFEEVVFDKEIDFRDSKFNCTSFNNSYFKDDALFENAIFKEVLYLTRAKYDRIYIRWSSISEEGKLGYDDTAYLLLIKNFKNLGFFQDAYDCYYQYRLDHLSKEVQLSDWRDVSLIFDYAAGYLYGWGVMPLFPLIWASILIAIFFLVYYFLNLGMDAQDALKFSTMVLLSGAGPFLSISCDLSRAGKYHNLALSEKIIGSMLFALFLVALSKTIIGDAI